MKRPVALVRISRDSSSVEVQRTQIERAAPAFGIDPAAIDYLEEEVCGAAEHRPVLEALLADAKRGKVGVLLVAALDRIGRLGGRTIVVMDELHALGVRIIFLREMIDYSTPTGQLVGGIFALLARQEREFIRARTRAGLNGWEKDGVPVPESTPGAVRVSVKRRRRVGRPPGVADPALLAALRARVVAGEPVSSLRGEVVGTVRWGGEERPWRPGRNDLYRLLRQ